MDDRALSETARAWGVDTGYHDWRGDWRQSTRPVLESVLASMGAEPGSSPPPSSVRVLRAGVALALPRPGLVVTEDGGTISVGETQPVELPLGYHRLHLEGSVTQLVVTPGRCAPPAFPGFGFAVQSYAARSRASWGIGDLADLRRLGRWAASLGATVLLASPLGAVLPLLPQEPSPYFPSSRRFHNPLYLRVEEVPGADGPDTAAVVATAGAAGRALNGHRRIDRDEVYRLKMAALEAIWAAFPGSAAFDRFRATRGPALEEHATFCALVELHRAPWPEWPVEHRHPGSPAVAEFRCLQASRVGFHEWLQWLLDDQLRRASGEIALASDLPIGFDPGGGDAWVFQDLLARGTRVGLPPDEFNTRGQDWGFPPFDPWKLRSGAYRPFISTVQDSLRHAGGLRVDHVAGLFRLYWLPEGAEPGDGVFVRYPHADLLGLLALESRRAGAFVVGEDLGVVENLVRTEMAAGGLLSYRLLWFEEAPPAHYPVEALAAITTHDLPTVAGLWSGADLEAQRCLGLAPNVAGTEGIRRRLAERLALPLDADPAEVAERAHSLLASAPSVLVTATLEDALGVEERPNHPGTVAEWPNWSLALPVSLEELERAPRVLRVAGALAGGRAGRPGGSGPAGSGPAGNSGPWAERGDQEAGGGDQHD